MFVTKSFLSHFSPDKRVIFYALSVMLTWILKFLKKGEE